MQVATCHLSISNSRFYSGTKISYVSIYKVCANTAVILQDFANGGPKEFVRVIQTKESFSHCKSTERVILLDSIEV